MNTTSGGSSYEAASVKIPSSESVPLAPPDTLLLTSIQYALRESRRRWRVRNGTTTNHQSPPHLGTSRMASRVARTALPASANAMEELSDRWYEGFT